MEVAFSNSFKKAFKKKVKTDPNLAKEFWISLELFISDPFNVSLRTHKLSGRLKHLWSFSIDYNNRVVFYFTGDTPQKAVLTDIGSHEEVY